MDRPARKRSVATNTEQVMEYMELDRDVASQNTTQKIEPSCWAILGHLQKAEYKKVEGWVPLDLTRKILLYQIHG